MRPVLAIVGGPSVTTAGYCRAHWRLPVILGGLALITVGAYWQVGQCEFVYFDDPGYIYENPRAERGLTWDNVCWAFRSSEQANWHPLTWLSHLTDCQLYGLRSGGHHVTGLLLHVANTLLLFAVLRSYTGAVWRSAIVAALFGIHPLHVESVAWVSERKDVLSTLLGLLALLAYQWYVRRGGLGRYALVAALFALSLMAKPMLVTLPLVLLLLDFWPLARLWPRTTWNVAGTLRVPSAEVDEGITDGTRSVPATFAWLVLEKVPLVALSAASSVVTYIVQRRGGSVVAVEHLGLLTRIENAILSYAAYIGKMFWPLNLGVLYPYLPIESHARVAVAAAGLLAVSAVVVWAAWRGRRYPAVGWFWFLGTLVPAIGLIQAGEQSMADRYTYVPLVGLFIVLTWGAADLLAPWRHRAALAAAVALPLLAACFILTMRQVGYWHNSETLLRHTLDVTTGNAITHNNLGNVLSMYQGRHAEAVPEYEEALRINPNYAEGHNNLANALSALGRADDALRHYQETLRINPDYNMARFNMGNLFLNRGEPQKAMALYQEALAHQPDYADALAGMGNAAVNLGQLEDAKRYFRQALHINPEHPGALTNLAVVLIIQGRTQEAEDHYRQVLQTHPNWLLGLNHLASLLATAADPACRNGAEAVQLAERACSLTGGRNPYLLDTLAAAYAEAGRFDQAVAAAKAAAALADANLAGQVQARLQLYQRRQPYHLPR